MKKTGMPRFGLPAEDGDDDVNETYVVRRPSRTCTLPLDSLLILDSPFARHHPLSQSSASLSPLPSFPPLSVSP